MHMKNREFKPMAKDRLKAVVFQLAQGLSYLHSKQIVHRDIKPENIFMSDTHEQSFPVIADFGYSKHLVDGQKLVKRCGTQGYTAPEILSNTPYSFPIDIWSLGVLIFQLKTGEMPFPEIDTAKTKNISQ